MNWWREISLILIIGSLTVFAETEKTDQEASGVISENDLRFLVKPSNNYYANNPTSKPTTVIVQPTYPYPYPSYPAYPQPSYPYPVYRPHRPHYPNHPRPTKPTPTKRPHKPSKPNHHHHYPPSNRPPYGYYPLYVSSSQGKKRPPILLVYGPEHQHYRYEQGYEHDNSYNYAYPSAENDEIYDDVVEEYQTELEEPENDYEVDGRHVSLMHDAVEDSDAVAINANPIKLPFGLQLASEKSPAADMSDKKSKHQEALIYLRNVKKGRKLEQE